MAEAGHQYNGSYGGEHLNHIAFPLGGIGAGMLGLNGAGGLTHVSVHNRPDIFHEPYAYAALCIRNEGRPNTARVLEGPVADNRIFGYPGAGNGARAGVLGFPRFDRAAFNARFPFAYIALTDDKLPVHVELTGWSPFTPGDADNSSLPVAALEYRFINVTNEPVDAVFSFHTMNFLGKSAENLQVRRRDDGFVLRQNASQEEPWQQADFFVGTDAAAPKIDCAWFRGGWFDSRTMVWTNVEKGNLVDREPHQSGEPSAGASIYLPVSLEAAAEKTLRLLFAWYVPGSDIRIGNDPAEDTEKCCCAKGGAEKEAYKPWYSSRFKNIDSVVDSWKRDYADLKRAGLTFSDAFYDTTLPAAVIEAVGANLTILKSPTVLRQTDGRLWGWEGCCDASGCCHGSCTHVWNYAQALPHLFPDLERSLRQAEFNENQDNDGHQVFRAGLPIRPIQHVGHAASDGQLGGIIKIYRDWRICGDTAWLRELWPQVRQSLDYCIRQWDPDHNGVLTEPHHNTYDIEFWGADGMCSSFYLGALKAAIRMGEALADDVSEYRQLLEKGTSHLNSRLFNGEYYIQNIQWRDLHAAPPDQDEELRKTYSPEAVALLEKEGPKYQYGNGCLSDGVLGAWMAKVCGVGDVLDPEKEKSHLSSVYRYNFRPDLSEHANPQRPNYALGHEGGLLLCSWPKGDALSLPFVYSNEVWTGIEYQVASHLIMFGLVDEGLHIVRACRDRYDGRRRNPFNEYECGHWYARAMSSYALLQALTGARYDAVTQTLHLAPPLKGDFRSFLCTASGFGTVGVKDGKPFLKVRSGTIPVAKIAYQAAN